MWRFWGWWYHLPQSFPRPVQLKDVDLRSRNVLEMSTLPRTALLLQTFLMEQKPPGRLYPLKNVKLFTNRISALLHKFLRQTRVPYWFFVPCCTVKSYQKYVVGLVGKRGYSRSKGDSKRGSSSPESQLCAALQSQLPVLSLQTEFFSRYLVSHWASAGLCVPYCTVLLYSSFFPCTHLSSGFYLGVQPTHYSSTLPVAAWSGVQLWACPSDFVTGSTWQYLLLGLQHGYFCSRLSGLEEGYNAGCRFLACRRKVATFSRAEVCSCLSKVWVTACC